MKTKKEVLTEQVVNNRNSFDIELNEGITEDVSKAMEVYSNQESLRLLNWIKQSSWRTYTDAYSKRWSDGKIVLTDEELYRLYKREG